MKNTRSLSLAALSAAVLGSGGCGGNGADAMPEADAEVKSEHGAEETSASVHLTAEQISALGIEIAVLDTVSGTNVLERPATLQMDPDRIALVGPRIEAKVERVLRDLGDAVQPGSPLAIMSSVELGESKAQHLALKARLETARASYDRERRLLGEQISSQAEVLEAEAMFRAAQADVDVIHERLRLYGLSAEAIEAIEPDADNPLSFFRLTSPVAGVVQRRDVSPGQTVGPSDTPIHVARLDRLWVMISAFEQDVPRLRTGQRVSLSVRSIPNRRFDAVTDWISYELDPETRSVRVRAIAQNPDGLLRAGMFGTAAIDTEGSAGYPTIPVDAVQTMDGRQVVFVPGTETGEFVPVAVRTGAEGGGMVELLAGLAPGDSAVVQGGFELMSAATASSRSAEHGH
jgi:cobalt-zinc-cadmium efflux system membrane fusion protein